MKPNTKHRLAHGGVPVGAVLTLCLLAFVAATVAMGYLLYQAKSGQLEAKRKLAEAEQKLGVEKAKTIEAEARKAEQERENRLAIAQGVRDSFAGRARVVTNSLHGLLDRIPQVERDLMDFRKGATGVPITRFPDLVEASDTFLAFKLSIPNQIGRAHV